MVLLAISYFSTLVKIFEKLVTNLHTGLHTDLHTSPPADDDNIFYKSGKLFGKLKFYIF